MRSLRRLLGLDPPDLDQRDTATVRRIAAELDALDPEEARFLAAFAYVLARVAHADMDVSDAEVREMVSVVREYSDLPEAEATLVVMIAKSQALALGGTENYVVTRQFRELSTRAQRVDLMRCLFAVAAADTTISAVENAEITQVGAELGFAREEVASLRAAFRDQLSVVKNVQRIEE